MIMFPYGMMFPLQYDVSCSDLIIGGDFNSTDNLLDKFRSNDIHATDKKSLCSLKSDFSLIDVWRGCHPHVVSFTWSNSGKTQASRLDWFLISWSLSDSIASCNIFYVFPLTTILLILSSLSRVLSAT